MRVGAAQRIVSAVAVALVVAACGADDGDDGGALPAEVVASTPVPSTSRSTKAAPATTAIVTTTSADSVAIVAPLPPASTIAELLALGRPIVLAHAGGDAVYPHSTPYAFTRSVADGVDMLDMDVNLTADGVPVVHHDATVDRTTDASGPISALTYAQAHALDDAYWFTPSCTCKDQPPTAYTLRGVRTGVAPSPAGFTPDDFAITSVREIIERWPRYPLNIEIKGDAPDAFATADALAAVLTDTGALARSVVTSFDDEVVAHFHQVAPTVAMSPGLDASAQFVLDGVAPPGWARIMQLPPTYQGIDVINADYVAKARAAGLVTWVWPNGEAEARSTYDALLALGVEGINAGNPPDGVAAARAAPPLPPTL